MNQCRELVSMRLTRRMIFLLTLAVATPSTAWACKLTKDSSWFWSDEQLVERTESIVEARVTSEELGKAPNMPITYKLKVVRTLKGPSGQSDLSVSIFPNRNARKAEYTKSCELRASLVKEKTYLIFVNAFHPKAIKVVDLKNESKDWLNKIEQLIGHAK